MQFIKSFSRITREDYDSVGYLAADLALILENNFRIPLTFVISSNAYDQFLEKNGLKNKLLQIYREVSTDKELVDAYEQVKKLFLAGELPSGFEEEIFEAYHSLGGSISNTSADSMIRENPNPKIMLVKSPGYILEENDLSGVFLNVQGEEKLAKAVKLCWASLFTPESAGYRISNSIKFPTNCGIIVQQFLTKGRNAITKVNNKTINVEAYLGIMDNHNELTKDSFIVDKEYLRILESKIKFQQYRISIDENMLIRHPMKQEGAEQKLNDKEIMEAARTGKRVSNYLGKNSVSHMTLLNDKFMVKLVYRKTSPEPLEYEEAKEEKIIVKEMREEIEEFEKNSNGEVSETEIIIEAEVPEEQEIEFVSFEEKTELIPEVEVYDDIEEEKNNYEEKIEIYDDPKEEIDTYEEIKVFEEKNIQEENEFIEKKPLIEQFIDEYSIGDEEVGIFKESEFEEENITAEELISDAIEEDADEFIMPLNEEIKEEFVAEIVEEEKTEPEEFESEGLREIKMEASKVVTTVFKELVNTIGKTYDAIYGSLPESFGEGVRDLSTRYNISEQDLMEVKRLRDEFVKNDKALSNDEIKFVLDTANKTLSTLK